MSIGRRLGLLLATLAVAGLTVAVSRARQGAPRTPPPTKGPPLRGAPLASAPAVVLTQTPVRPQTPDAPLRLEIPRGPDGELALSWAHLAAFEYPVAERPSDPRALLPGAIRDLHGQQVSLMGHVVPLALQGEDLTRMLLTRYMNGCCFGQAPKITEWVEVVLATPRRASELVGETVVVLGRLEVGERRDETGQLSSIYRIQAEEILLGM